MLLIKITLKNETQTYHNYFPQAYMPTPDYGVHIYCTLIFFSSKFNSSCKKAYENIKSILNIILLCFLISIKLCF